MEQSASPLINGLQLNFTDSGPQDSGGEVVMFIHAFPFDSEMWMGQCETLKGRFRTIRFDLRGFGKTQPQDPFYTIDDLVDDAVHLLDHLKVERAVWCGLSLGGYVALRAAETEPSRVSGLILCDTRAEADSNEAKTRRARQLRQLRTGRIESFARGMLTNVLAPRAPLALVEALHQKITSCPMATLAAALMALAARTDSSHVLSDIGVPTLVINGEFDELTPPETARSLQSRIPGAELALIPQAGHLANIENPAAFNQALLSFLERRLDFK